MNSNIRFCIEVLFSLAILSLLLGVGLTAVSYGSVADIPVAFGLIFSSFLIIGRIFAGITMLFPERRDGE